MPALIFHRSRHRRADAAGRAEAFILPPGYHLELVLSDPDIVNPAAIAFDGNGRMYVNEIVTYMLDVDGSREHEPISRISVTRARKATARTTSTRVFIDKLVLPRIVLPLDNGAMLTKETDADDIFK